MFELNNRNMARLFVGAIIAYFLSLIFFIIINISLVFLKSKSLSLVINNIVIFGLFPILVFTKEGRSRLLKAINFK